MTTYDDTQEPKYSSSIKCCLLEDDMPYGVAAANGDVTMESAEYGSVLISDMDVAMINEFGLYGTVGQGLNSF